VQRYSATHCNTLQHTATHYTTPRLESVQQTATHCNTLQHTASQDFASCSEAHNTATHYNALQHIATHCNTLHLKTLRRTPKLKYCITLEYVATHCNTLQHTAKHRVSRRCFVLQSSIYCLTLHHSTTHGNTLQHTATHCVSRRCVALKLIILHHIPKLNTLQNKPPNKSKHTLRQCAVHSVQYSAAHCNTLQHTATHCNTLQHTATHCNTLQHTASQIIVSRSKAATAQGAAHTGGACARGGFTFSCVEHAARSLCMCLCVRERERKRKSTRVRASSVSLMLWVPCHLTGFARLV